MPHYPVLQPDNQWALFSTIVDSFTMLDMTADEVLDELADWHRFNRDKEMAHLLRIAGGAIPDYPHWESWSDAAAWSMFVSAGDAEVARLIQQRTPPEQMEQILALVAAYQNEDGA